MTCADCGAILIRGTVCCLRCGARTVSALGADDLRRDLYCVGGLFLLAAVIISLAVWRA